MTEFQPIPMPDYDPTSENFAEVGTEAWIANYGGRDVTGQHGEADDYGTWVGDVELDDTVYRLTVIEQTNEIDAEEL